MCNMTLHTYSNTCSNSTSIQQIAFCYMIEKGVGVPQCLTGGLGGLADGGQW